MAKFVTQMTYVDHRSDDFPDTALDQLHEQGYNPVADGPVKTPGLLHVELTIDALNPVEASQFASAALRSVGMENPCGVVVFDLARLQAAMES